MGQLRHLLAKQYAYSLLWEIQRVEGRGVAESCFRGGGGEGGLRVYSLVRTSAEIEHEPCVTPSRPYRSHTVGVTWACTRGFVCCLCLHLFFFMMCSKGLRKSFWNLKLASSPFSKNFMDSCLSESTAKMATSSLELQPTCTEWKTHFRKVTMFKGCNLGPVYQEQTVPPVKTLITLMKQKKIKFTLWQEWNQQPLSNKIIYSLEPHWVHPQHVGPCTWLVKIIKTINIPIPGLTIPHSPCWSGLQ